MSHRRAINAALLSLLVFPGAGQLYLGRRVRALLFAVPAALSVLPTLLRIYRQTTTLVERILNGALPSDTDIMAIALTDAGENGSQSGWVLAIFLVCWLWSVWDGYMIGKR